MGDVDGIVERNGHFLMMEWKSPGGVITRGQHITFASLTADNINFTVYVLEGDPRTMEITSHIVYFNNYVQHYQVSSFEQVLGEFQTWAYMADQIGHIKMGEMISEH